MKLGLMFFASSEEALSGNKYRLVMESARFADANGFSSVWVPERHFTEFGSLYPNPAVLHAALAAATSRVRLLAGSVVAPLHHPVRIAEEWAMVDNLSNGRVGISFASGWNPDDFAFCPERYADRQEVMLENIRSVRHLWGGGKLETRSGNGKPVELRIYPTPVQRELPVWLTAAGNPQTFARAGEIGANLLTHVLDQDEDQLAQKIAIYRQARAKGGHDPLGGQVTVMLHTFVGADADTVREQARAPFCNYIRSNIGLLNGLAQSRGQQIDVRNMPARELDEFVAFLYERFAQSRGLIGTPESCMPLLERLAAIGVDEVACLLDFGPPVELILENLPQLARLRRLAQARDTGAAQRPRFDPAAVRARCTAELSGEAFNDTMRGHGVELDGQFLGIRRIWRAPGEALGEIELPAAASAADYEVHPAFLDACSRVLAAAVDAGNDGELYLPAAIRAVHVHHRPDGARAWSHAVLHEAGGAGALEGDVRVYDPAGRLLIAIEGLRLQRALGAQAEPAPALDRLFYRRDWQPLDAAVDDAFQASGRWAILADRGGAAGAAAEQFAAALEQAGGRCSLHSAGTDAGELLAGDGAPKGILHLGALDLAPGDLPGYRRLAGEILALAKTLAAAAAPQPRLWLFTAGAMPVLAGEATAPAQAPLWGLGGAIGAEHPELWGGLCDLDPAHVCASALAGLLGTDRNEGMLAVRGGRSYAARIVRDESVAAAAPPAFGRDATYLVTGGLGGLGLRLARWLRARGAGHIVLAGRRPPDAARAAVLEQLGARFLAADLARREDVAALLERIQGELPPLRGIFHLAGTLDDARLAEQDRQRFLEAGLGKIDGAWHLHELSAGLPLDHFVLFSSMAALVTLPGQGNYAAANGFLDALAHRRRAQGRPALSVNWGPWAEIGHAATDYGRRAHAQLGRLGVAPLTPDQGVAALERLLAAGAVQNGVARIDWPQLFQAGPAVGAAPLLSALRAPDAEAAPIQETELLARLRACPPPERQEAVTQALAGILAEALRLPDADAVAPSRSFFDMGLDSIIALELTQRISASFGHPFRGTLFFSYTNLEALSGYILGELAPALESAAEPAGDDLDELSEEEFAELIAQEISRA